MTNKELIIAKIIVTAIICLAIGGLVVSLRYDSEIRTDQLDLQAQVDKIVKDKAVIDDLIQKLIFHIEQLKLEREDLRRLQIELSKGEG